MFKYYRFLLLLFFITANVSLSLYSQVVVINEVCTSPAQGTSSSTINANSLYNTSSTEQPAANREWIELYNPNPCNSVDISCYTLAGNMLQSTGSGDTPNWGAFTFPSGTVIPPLGFVIVGGNASQVPVLDFNLNIYRQSTFGVQYLDGDPTRWFLRDEYGWVALYNPSGSPVDAVYWDAYGNAANLYSQTEYQENVVTTTSCSGTQSLTAARNIPGIEYAGMSIAGNDVSFQRIMDGSTTWYSGPLSPTPRSCNGPCVVPPVLSALVQNESCAGNDGTITLSIQDGHTGPYTINWLQPAGIHTNTVSGLGSGTYIVQVVDAYNCFIVYDTVTVGTMPDPTVTFTNIINESCSLGNGSVQAVANNANFPVTYHWSVPGSGNTATLSSLQAGDYSVTITDNLGCTASNMLTLINFTGPGIHTDSIRNEMCSNADGAIYTEVNGGSPPFTYLWNSSPQQNNQNLMNVHAGSYTVTITDVYGCTATTGGIITNTPPPLVYFSDIQSDTCRKRTGAASITVSGGNPPYSYLWSVDSLNNSTSITNLSEGVYYVSVTDSFCTTVATVNIPLIPGPKADFRFYPPITTIENPTFRFEDWSTGVINNWLWNFGDNSFSNDRSPFHTYDSVGNYNVKLIVTNQFGCIDSVIKTAIVLDLTTLFVPSCFTPNGDGVNDFFFVAGQNILDYEFFLYNRWGELIYTSKNIYEQWDGKYKGSVVPDGVYSWLVNYSEDWAGFLQISKSLKGTLTVLR